MYRLYKRNPDGQKELVIESEILELVQSAALPFLDNDHELTTISESHDFIMMIVTPKEQNV
jgi:hypothetical protein